MRCSPVRSAGSAANLRAASIIACASLPRPPARRAATLWHVAGEVDYPQGRGLPCQSLSFRGLLKRRSWAVRTGAAVRATGAARPLSARFVRVQGQVRPGKEVCPLVHQVPLRAPADATSSSSGFHRVGQFAAHRPAFPDRGSQEMKLLRIPRASTGSRSSKDPRKTRRPGRFATNPSPQASSIAIFTRYPGTRSRRRDRSEPFTPASAASEGRGSGAPGRGAHATSNCAPTAGPTPGP